MELKIKQMRIVFLFIILGITLSGCDKYFEQKIDEGSLRIFFASKIRNVDSTMELQEMKLVRLDTTTLKIQYINIWNSMYDETKEYEFEMEALLKKIKLNNELKELYEDLSYKLWKIYKDDVIDDLNKVSDYLDKDSLLRVDMKHIDTLIEYADSIVPVSYVAVCAYVIKKKDLSVIKDTARIRIDLDYNILDKAEYTKQLNHLYTPVSDFKMD